MTPHCSGYGSPLLLLAIPLSLSQTLEGLFELTQLTSRSLPHTVMLPELQRYNNNERYTGGLRTQLKTTEENLTCVF